MYAPTDSGPVPSAVILDGCQRERYDLPRSTDEVTWRFLGVIAGGEAAMTRYRPGARLKAVVLVGPDDERQLLRCCLPADAQVLTPGQTAQSVD